MSGRNGSEGGDSQQLLTEGYQPSKMQKGYQPTSQLKPASAKPPSGGSSVKPSPAKDSDK